MVFRLVGWILSNFCSRKAPKLINQTIIAKLLCMWLPRYVFFSYFFEKNSQMTCWSRMVIWRLYNFWLRKAPTSIKWIIRSKRPFGLLRKYGFIVFLFLFLFFLSFVCVCVCFAYLIHNIQCLRGRSKWSKLPSSYWRMMQMLIIQTVIWLFFATLVKYAIFVCICEYVFEIIFHIENRKQNCMNLSSWL